jgi:hypothetical protein
VCMFIAGQYTFDGFLIVYFSTFCAIHSLKYVLFSHGLFEEV